MSRRYHQFVKIQRDSTADMGEISLVITNLMSMITGCYIGDIAIRRHVYSWYHQKYNNFHMTVLYSDVYTFLMDMALFSLVLAKDVQERTFPRKTLKKTFLSN